MIVTLADYLKVNFIFDYSNIARRPLLFSFMFMNYFLNVSIINSLILFFSYLVNIQRVLLETKGHD